VVEEGKRHQSPWSRLEDDRLLRAIHKFGLGNWVAVAQFVGAGRSRSQCSQRWNRGLNPQLRKYSWSPDEEQQLKTLVDLHGMKAWTTIAREIGTRSDVQCRYHYMQMQRDQSGLLNVKPVAPAISDRLNLKTTKTPSIIDLFSSQEVIQLFPAGEARGTFTSFF
jgi:hypothetical protein